MCRTVTYGREGDGGLESVPGKKRPAGLHVVVQEAQI